MRTIKNISLVFSLFFLAFAQAQAQSPGTTFYGVQATPVCWTTGAGVDSSLYQVSLSPAGATKPTQMFFYSPIVGTGKVQAVTVTGGIIQPGTCFEKQQLLDNDTIIISLSQLLVDNDTIISNLQAIATAIATALGSDSVHIVSEPGCLVLTDTAGCGLSGLRVDISALPVGFKTTYLNGTSDTTLIGGAMVSSCSNFAAALNLIQGVDLWSCCNDSLVVNSTDTDAYASFTFISTITGDTITRVFADTVGNGVSTQVLPVEIIKVLNRDGDILDLRYYSSDGATEYTGQGELSVGPCVPDETNQFYQNVTASLSNIVTLLGGDCTNADESALSSITTNTTYSANTLNSISIIPLSGTVTLDTGGGAVTLQNGFEYWFGAEGCAYLTNAFAIAITGGTVQVSRLY